MTVAKERNLRLPARRLQPLAVRLGLGEKLKLDRISTHNGKAVRRSTWTWFFSQDEIDTLLATDNEKAPRNSAHAERRAEEFAKQLISEGERSHIAWARARAAYGRDDRAPAGNPRPSRDVRRAWLEHAATSRRSERLPSVEGRTTGATGARR